MTDRPERRVRITGAGQSAVGRPSDKTPLALTVDACIAAVEAAGLSLDDVDGITTYPGPVLNGGGFSPVGATETVLALGLKPVWVGASTEGHAHMGAMFGAIMAIASGLCRHVLVFRTVAEASARAGARHAANIGGPATAHQRIHGGQSWTIPFGAHSAAMLYGLYAQAYFDRYDARPDQLGAIAVNARAMAAHNPNAVYRDPISIDDYLASRMISTPLRLYDCDTHIDGSTAVLLSRCDIAADMALPPLGIEAIGMGLKGIGAGHHEGDFSRLPGAEQAGAMLWSRTDFTPQDLDFAQIYDGFSILTLLWLEALQICAPGEAAAFVEGGARIGLDGALPLNTGGGQLSAGRFHGYGHIHEACLQLWDRAGARQLAAPRLGVVSNGGFGYGTLLLRREDR